ncbi:MAG TPA: glycosyltransferase, partial [Acidimicrobiales bacterium]|nr:glycosyltransferase [Acidimicrobiales bacterium]
LGRLGLGAFASVHRGFDVKAARRARHVVVNSRHVADRVRRWWGLEAEVVPPPVDTQRFTHDPSVEREDFFLLAGRLVPYKRPEVAVAAAVRAGVRLVVAGGGRSRPAVDAAAGPGVEVLGPVDDTVLTDLYRRCRALVFPGEEDFGIVPVEAQSCGAPMLAPAVGGVVDTVVDGVTGTLYRPQPDNEVEALASAMRAFDDDRFDSETISTLAGRFSTAAFHDRFRSTVERIVAEGETDPSGEVVRSAA